MPSVNDVLERLKKNNIDPVDAAFELDQRIYEVKASEADKLNDTGIEAQLEFLIKALPDIELEELLSEVEENLQNLDDVDELNKVEDIEDEAEAEDEEDLDDLGVSVLVRKK